MTDLDASALRAFFDDRPMPPTRPRRTRRRHSFLLAFSALPLAFLGFLAYVELAGTPPPEEAIPQTVAVRSGGAVQEVLVREGDLVEPGEPLVRFGGTAEPGRATRAERIAALELEIERLRAFITEEPTDFVATATGRAFPALAVKEEELLARQVAEREAHRKAFRETLDRLSGEVAAARQRLEAAKVELKRSAELYEARLDLWRRGLASEAAYREAKEALDSGRSAAASARKALRQALDALAGARNRHLLYEARLRRDASIARGAAQAELAALRAAPDDGDGNGTWVVRAPLGGVVRGIAVAAGDVIAPDAALMDIVPLDRVLPAAGPSSRPRTEVYLDIRRDRP